MDALTLAEGAASLAVTAGKVSSSLRDVINTAGSRGKPGGPGPLSSLAGEVSVLLGLLERVDKILRECHVQALSLAHIDEVLWDPIGNAMMDCKATLEALDNLIAAIRGTSLARSILFRRSGVQARVDAQARDLVAFVGKTYQSSCAMQTIEAVINISLSFRGSTDVSQEALFRNLESLEALLQHGRAVVSDSSSFKSDPFAAQISRNLQALIKAAERFHSSARTTASMCYGQLARAGSSCSETLGLTDFQRERIETWNRLQPVREESYMDGTTSAVVPADDGKDEDTDSDLEFDLIQSFERLADKSLRRKDYAKAEQFFRKVLKTVSPSDADPSHQTAVVKTMKLRLALSCCLQGNWKAAEDVLNTMAKSRAIGDLPVFHFLHATALAYVEANCADEALASCKTAIQGRKRLLGRTSEQYFESLGLLVTIHEKNGDILEAEALRHSLLDIPNPLSAGAQTPFDYLFTSPRLRQLVSGVGIGKGQKAAQSQVGSDAGPANEGHSSPNPKPPTAKTTRPDSQSSYTARPSAPVRYIELDTGKEPTPERHCGEHESDEYLAIADSQVGVSDTGKEPVATRLHVGEYDTEKELAPHHQLGGYDTEKELVPIDRQIGECDTDKELVSHHRWGEYYDTEKEIVPTEHQIGEADTDKEFVAEILPQSAHLLPYVVGLTPLFPDRTKPLGPQAYRSLTPDRSLPAPGVARAIKNPKANLASEKKAVSKAPAKPDDSIRTLGLNLTLDGPYIAGLTSKGVVTFTAWLEYPSGEFEGYRWRSSWNLSIRSQGRPPTAPVETRPNSWMSYRRSMLALMEPGCKDISEPIERLCFCVADIEKFVQKRMKQARDTGYLGSAPLGTGFVALPGKILIAQGETPKLRSIFTETTLWKDATLVPQCSAILSSFLRGCMRSVPAAKPKRVVVLHCGVVSTETQRFRIREAGNDQYKTAPVTSPISNSFGSICIERAFVDLVRRKLNQLMISSNTKLESAHCEKLMRSFCRQFRKSILYEFDNDDRDWPLAIDLPTDSLTFDPRELKLSNAEILACFEPTVRGIRTVMGAIISRSPEEPVTHVCLAGRLAASSFLYSQLQDKAASLRLGVFVVRDSNCAFTAASAAYDHC